MIEYTELLEEFFVQLDPLEQGFSGALVEFYQRRAEHPPLPPLAHHWPKGVESLSVAQEEESIPKRLEDPIELPPPVFEGLEVVQESEETNMLDYQAVQDIAIRMGYPETAMWVREHRHEYSEGIFRGFLSTE